jgi:hypothetical protein
MQCTGDQDHMDVRVSHALPSATEWAPHLAWAGELDYFASRDWFENFVETVADSGSDVQFVIARDDRDEIVGVLPLWCPPGGRAGLVRRFESLGNYYTCLFEPILCEDRVRASASLGAMIEYVAETRAGWSCLRLHPLPADGWYVPEMIDAFARKGLDVRQFVAFGNWYLDSAGLDFAAYFASRKKKLRSTIRSKTNQLANSAQVEIRIVQHPEEVDEGYAAYLDVYNSSWKVPEPYPNFIPGLMRALARRGALRLGLLSIDGIPAAAQLWFVHGQVASIFKLAYRETYSHFSVGSLLQMHLMEHVLDKDHVKVVDFLSGDDEYKAHWMSARRERIGLEVINGRSLGGLYLHVRRHAGKVKKWLQARQTQRAATTDQS